MSSRNEIILSITEYEEQLRKVESALAASLDNAEQTALQSLKHDLEELLSLTKETLRQSEHQSEQDLNNTGSCSSNQNENDTKPCYDSEMALFMDEIKKIDDDCVNEQQFDEKLETIKDELKAMVGRKCSAPHNHTWGARAYHNAIICGVDDSREYDMDNIENFQLRILFTNPTHKEMIPCSYYLDGDCKFDSDQCHYSHGELIPFGELKEYIEPDFTKLKRNCNVLAKMDDKMWHKGKVICANFIEKECRVRLEARNREIDCHFENLLPLYHDDFSDSSSSEDDNDDDDVTDVEMFKRANLVEKSLLTYSADQALGEWEKHTKGIGSKLMQKMGYVIGTGLGNDGDGIVVPISAQVLPPGRSLDYCMQLREAANGDKDLFSVERNIKRVKKKQDALNAKAYEREKSKTDMFTFLNDNILSSSVASCNAKSSNALQQKDDFKNHSNKNLNVESLKIADDIRKKEKEIRKIKESLSRQSSGTEIYKRLQTQLSVKDAELANLKKSEISVAREQSLRKHKDKLSVF